MSYLQPPPQTVMFLVGITYSHFIISKEAVIQKSPYLKWLLSDSGTIASETGVVSLPEFEPKIFQYLEEYFNTGIINSFDAQAKGALMVLAKLWMLAEFAGMSLLQNVVMEMLHPALYGSNDLSVFFHYVYSNGDRYPWRIPVKKQVRNVQGAKADPKYTLKLLARRYAAWTFSKEMLRVVCRVVARPTTLLSCLSRE